MKKLQHLQSFESYIASKQEQDELNEANFKTLALAGLMGASALSASGAGNKGKDGGEKDRIEQFAKTTANTKKELNHYLATGWTIKDSVTKELLLEAPKEIDMETFTIDVSANFESGKFQITPLERQSISDTMELIFNKGLHIAKIIVESSTDKTGISQRLQATGIKNNKDLSTERNQEVVDFLYEYNFITDSNVIGRNILFDMGTKDDPSARYVKIIIHTMNPIDFIATANKTQTTYNLIKPLVNKEGKSQHKNIKIQNLTQTKQKVSKNEVIEKIGAVKCSPFKSK